MERIDYVKVRFQMPSGEQGELHRERLIRHQYMLEDLTNAGIQGGSKVHTDYSARLPYTTKYLEIWGDLANEYYERQCAALFPSDVMRLDFRVELPADVDLNAIAAKAETVGRRQFQKFNQRVREKSDDRSSGGFGLAKGSHKSEKRVSVYKRGQELPAAEIQLRGKKAAEFHSEVRRMFDAQIEKNDPAEVIDPREIICSVGRVWLDDDLQSEVGRSIDSIEGEALHEPYDEAETRLATLDALWDLMGTQERQAFILAKLFGDDDMKWVKTK